jgi:ribonuclease HI
MAEAMKRVEIFTDGACKGNPGPGGWAALLRIGAREKELSGRTGHTTNNRMELTAVIRALQALKEPCSVAVHSDSRYVVDGMRSWIEGWRRNGWRTAARKPVLNSDLWQELYEAAAPHRIDWVWVRGHDGHPENERVDQLACVEAAAAAS